MTINPVLIDWGIITIRWYGVMYLLGIGLGALYAYPKLSHRFGWSVSEFTQVVSDCVFGVLIGGRLGYVCLYDWAYYAANPLQIGAVWNGGMSFHGGLIGVGLAIALNARRLKVSVWPLLDCIGVASTIGLGLGRIGNFINGELGGRVTTMPWGSWLVSPDGLSRHPSQLYEAFLEGGCLFICLHLAYKHARLADGQLIGLFAMLYSLFRFVGEWFREPDAQLGFVVGWLTMGQVLSVVMGAIGVIIWVSRSSRE